MKKLGLLFALAMASLVVRAEQPITPEFRAALRSGDVKSVRAQLANGAAVNARDAEGNTPLILVAVYGDVASLKTLLDHGADINATNAAGASALIRAAANYEKVRLLVERGAKVNARAASGNTPLILAARPANSYRAVKLLLERGAEAKATNAAGANALISAAAGGDVQTVRLLLKQGLDVNSQPQPTEFGFLFGGGRSALMWAAFRGDIAMMKVLLAAGADVNAMGGLGTALAQATWADRADAARLLLKHGARLDLAGPLDGFAPLHWAAGSENRDTAIVKMFLEHKADPNAEGGEPVDAYLSVPQTPLMLANRRGDTPIRHLLVAAGATNGTPDSVPVKTPPTRTLPARLDSATLRAAIAKAVPPLQRTALHSKKSFVNHVSRQDCTSCHSQYLPMAAIGFAQAQHVAVNDEAQTELVNMVARGEFASHVPDLEPLFHPDAPQTKGYEAFGFAGANLPASDATDAWVNHLAAIQAADGQWHNNLPRPPMQTGDIGATALAVHALTRYSLPGRQAEFSRRVEAARQWLWKTKPENMDGRIYQLLGLHWAGESPRKLQSMTQALLNQQRENGGWAQLPDLKSDAYATSQAIYALRVAAGMKLTDSRIDRGVRYLLSHQLADGTWYVRRRTFPFQPTMSSGFPHGRDSWISTAATSWAVLALSWPEDSSRVAQAQ